MQYIAKYKQGSSTSEGAKSSLYIHGQLCKPFSQLWYCPNCGSNWCNIEAIDNKGNRSYYTSVANICSLCSEGDLLLTKTRITLPGSILMEGYNTIDELSEEMLRRELLLELKAMKLLIDKGVL